MTLAAFQDELSTLLLREAPAADNDVDAIADFEGHGSARRLNVYRTRIADQFARHIFKAYPTVRNILGEAFLDQAARGFLHADPPRGASLIDQASGFADFLDHFEPAAGFPYLADVAALDFGVLKALLAPRSERLAHEHFLDISAEDLAQKSATLDPACHWLSSSFAICDIWQIYNGVVVNHAVDHRSPQNVLILRPRDKPEVYAVSGGLLKVLDAVDRGASLAQALAEGRAHGNDFDPGDALHFLVQHSVLVKMH